MDLSKFASIPYLTMLGVVFALVSLLLWLLFLNERVTVGMISNQRLRQFALLTLAAFYFLEMGLALLGVPGAIGALFWTFGLFILLGGPQVILGAYRAFSTSTE